MASKKKHFNITKTQLLKRKMSKKATKNVKTAKKPGKTIKINDLNNLSWKPISLPDRIGEEGDGIMGFEELDGVAVNFENILSNDGTVIDRKVSFSVQDPDQMKDQEKNNDKISEENDKTEEINKENNKKRKNETESNSNKSTKLTKKKHLKSTTTGSKQKINSKNPFDLLENDVTDDKVISLSAWTDNFHLSDPILHALNNLGYEQPTAIQRMVIPKAIEGIDIIGKASTGSGKTLAFAIPILEKYLSTYNPNDDLLYSIDGTSGNKEKKLRCQPVGLIFAPTRELVTQIADHIKQIAKFTAATVMTITGGLSVEKQKRLLYSNPTVVVATPGRFHEVISNSNGLIEAFSKIKILVLDEADRLLQKGKYKELEDVITWINEKTKKNSKSSKHQTLVFSATFQKDLAFKLGNNKKSNNNNNKINNNIIDSNQAMEYILERLHFWNGKPELIDANPSESVSRKVKEGIVECGEKEKDLYLYYFCLKYPGRTLVFTNSIDAVKRIVPLLRELGFKDTIGLHSHMIQKQRLRAIEKFKENENSILVATDVAARGLDIQKIQHVIHYNLPRSADMYIHRSGRTSRGISKEGVAVLICSPTEVSNLRRMLIKLNKSLSDMKSFDQLDRSVATSLKERVYLAKLIADSEREHGIEAGKNKDTWLKEAIDDLGGDLSSSSDKEREDDDYIFVPKTKKNIKNMKNSKNKKEKVLSKVEIKLAKEKLKILLSRPINTSGISTRYLTSGSVNIAHKLLTGGSHSAFLGQKVSTAYGDLTGKSR